MQQNQKILITDKSSVLINSVTSVKSFDEYGVVLSSEFGMLAVEGSNLQIENFEKATSEILITGNILGVYYLEKRDKKRGRVTNR